MNRTAFILACALLLGACSPRATWSSEEKAVILGGGDVMRVLTVADRDDSLLLRRECMMLLPEDIAAEEYAVLARRMVATVTSPEQDGVGIAGPQVGISRRVVAVQRFDKEGEPFEVYPNIGIVAMRGEKVQGAEGCLSVPGKRGQVSRWRDITISYTSPLTLRDTTEDVEGFTAVIFQHETDHLSGVIYTDKADSVFVK